MKIAISSNVRQSGAKLVKPVWRVLPWDLRGNDDVTKKGEKKCASGVVGKNLFENQFGKKV